MIFLKFILIVNKWDTCWFSVWIFNLVYWFFHFKYFQLILLPKSLCPFQSDLSLLVFSLWFHSLHHLLPLRSSYLLTFYISSLTFCALQCQWSLLWIILFCCGSFPLLLHIVYVSTHLFEWIWSSRASTLQAFSDLVGLQCLTD